MSSDAFGSISLSLEKPSPLNVDIAADVSSPLTGKAPKMATLDDIRAAFSSSAEELASPRSRSEQEEDRCWTVLTDLLGRGFNYCWEKIAALFACIFCCEREPRDSSEQEISLSIPSGNPHAREPGSPAVFHAIEAPQMSEEEIGKVRAFVNKWTQFSQNHQLPVALERANEGTFADWANDLWELPEAARRVWERVFIPHHKETIGNLEGRTYHPEYGIQICKRTTSDALKNCVGVRVADVYIMHAFRSILSRVPNQDHNA